MNSRSLLIRCWAILIGVLPVGGLFAHPTDKPDTFPVTLPSYGDEAVLEVSYIGNMGVLVEANGKTVLIDGLHQKYRPAYLYPTAQMIHDLFEHSYQGFTEIEINLVTHNHKDHFSPEINLAFLQKNPNAITIAAQPVKDEISDLAARSNDQILERIFVVREDYEVYEYGHQDITVKSVRCDHTYQARHQAIQNRVFLVEIDSFSILHVGDTDWDLGTDGLTKILSAQNEIDIAILPYWMLLGDDAKTHISAIINPRRILVSHIDPNLIDEVEEGAKLEMPHIEFLTELMKTVRYSK